VWGHWGPGKPKYRTEEERKAAEKEARRRQNERKRLQPPEGYIDQEAALNILGVSRQRLHALVVRGAIKTHPPYEERAETGQRHWRVWYNEENVRRYAEQRQGGSDDEQI
jgi:hypothetical protein